MTTNAESILPQPSGRHIPVEELARRQGVETPRSLDDLACPELWDSDEEYERFIAEVYQARQAGMA